MPNLLVRDVPADLHAELVRRAAADGQSLQQYLLSELRHAVRRPRLADVLDRIDAGAGGRTGGTVGFDAAVAAVAEDRDRDGS